MVIQRITRLLAASEVQALLAQTEAIEAAGGMLTNKGDRRRTKGGVFFALVRARLVDTGRQTLLKAVFPSPGTRARPVRPGRPGRPALTSTPPIVARVRHRKKLGPGDLRPAPHPHAHRAAPPAAAPAQGARILPALDAALAAAGVGGLRRRHVDAASRRVQLGFDFPAAAGRRYGEILAEVGQRLQLELVIAPAWNQAAVAQLIQEVLPAGAVQKVSMHEARNTVVLRLSAPLADEVLAQAAQALDERAGIMIALAPSAPAPLAEAPVAAGTRASHDALEAARRRFAQSMGCYHIGADVGQERLLLRFSFPDVARVRYADELAALEAETGWTVALHPEPHQQAMEQLARSQLAVAGCQVVKVALHRDGKRVVATVSGELAESAAQEARARFVEASGWSIEVERR